LTLGPPIAEGRTAEIYAWGEGRVLKLYRPEFPPVLAEREALLGAALQAAGLPVPALGERVEVAGRQGLVFERVDGPDLLDALARRPWLAWRYARQLADLHLAVHAVRGMPGLPRQRERLRFTLGAAPALPPAVREAALRALDTLPDGDQLCHGDLHPKNVLLCGRRAVIIDWLDATAGHPLCDLARTTCILQGLAASALVSRAQGVVVRWFDRWFRARYLRRMPKERERLVIWVQVNAAARLREGIPAFQSWLLAEAGKLLAGQPGLGRQDRETT